MKSDNLVILKLHKVGAKSTSEAPFQWILVFTAEGSSQFVHVKKYCLKNKQQI